MEGEIQNLYSSHIDQYRKEHILELFSFYNLFTHFFNEYFMCILVNFPYNDLVYIFHFSLLKPNEPIWYWKHSNFQIERSSHFEVILQMSFIVLLPHPHWMEIFPAIMGLELLWDPES